MSDEAHAARAETIGASEVAIPLGLARWGTQAELARKKREGARTPSSHAMDAGNIFEFAVLAEFARRNPGLRLLLNWGSMRGPGRSSATPDAIAIPPDRVPEDELDSFATVRKGGGFIDMQKRDRAPTKLGPIIVIDAKNPDDCAWWDENQEADGGLPRSYWSQVQMQMHVCVHHGAEVAYGMVAAHSRVQGWRQIRVDYDPDWCRTAVETVTAWYDRHVVEGVPCPAGGDSQRDRDADAWGNTTAREDGADYIEVPEDDAKTLRLVETFRKWHGAGKRAGDANAKLKDALRRTIGGAKGLILPSGDKIAATGSGSRTSVEWKRIAEQLAASVPESVATEIRERHTTTSECARGITPYWAKEEE